MDNFKGQYNKVCCHQKIVLLLMQYVLEVAKTSNSHEFIIKLKDGYNTKIGQNGCKLSGSQRQRIAIARALLKKSDIIVLDEVTSSLDPENENLIKKTIENSLRDYTVIIIAHKLSTIENADKIYELDKGSIKII